jgi:hypothetical protein
MRTFYIFKIKKEISIIMKETPYNLFKTINDLYYQDSNYLGVSFNVYKDIFDSFNKQYINKKIYNTFKDYKYYSRDGDVHYIYNKYRPENSSLKVFNGHIILKSDTIKPTLLINYLHSNNLFVCDFKNKDYFWLNEFVM